jgi:hypothetical protein
MNRALAPGEQFFELTHYQKSLGDQADWESQRYCSPPADCNEELQIAERLPDRQKKISTSIARR